MPEKKDIWWKRQLADLLAREEAGVPPLTLANRWLLLASRTWPESRWCVTFDVPDHIYHILDDPDVRAKDAIYAERQRSEAWEWLNG